MWELLSETCRHTKHLVPVLLPRDVVKGTEILSDPEVRNQADVLHTSLRYMSMVGILSVTYAVLPR